MVGVAAMVGGLFGGLGAHYVDSLTEDDGARRGTERALATDREPTQDLRAPDEDEQTDLAALRRRLASMERRLSLVTAALAQGQGVAVDGELDGSANPSQAMDDVDVADPIFEAAVLDIIDRQEEREEEERDERRRTLRKERSERYAEALTEKLSLTDEQREKVAELVREHFESFRALRDRDNPNRPVTRSEWRKHMDEMNRRVDEKLAGLLGPQQFRAYEDLQPEDKIGWRRGRD